MALNHDSSSSSSLDEVQEHEEIQLESEQEESDEEAKQQNSGAVKKEEFEDDGLEEVVHQKKPKSIPESESKDGSFSDSDEIPVDFIVKPSKPMSNLRPSSKRKRPGEENSRRKKSKVVSNGDEEKKRAATVWSEDDEIALLKGMVDYQLEKGVDPYSDMAGFFGFVKDSIHFDVKRRQVTDKLWRFKNKYLHNEFVLSKPHESRLFEISKKIKAWGGGMSFINAVSDNSNVESRERKDKKRGKVVVNNHVPKLIENVKKEDVKEEDWVQEASWNEIKDFCSMYPQLSRFLELEMSFHLSLPNDVKNYVKERIRLMGREKANELEGKWNDLHLEEFELYAKKVQLMNEQINLVLDGIKSS